MLAYPNANLWSHTHQIQVANVAAGAAQTEGSLTGKHAITYKLVNETIVTDANLQKQLSSEYERNSKIKSQEYSKFLQDNFGLGDNYTEDHDEGRLLAFIERLRAICFGGDNGGLSYQSYNQVVAIKSFKIYTNNKVHDPNGFKDQVKIKYEAIKATVGRFPNGTAILMHLLSNDEPDAFDWDGYCALPAERRLAWEERADALNQAMSYIMNSKNEIAKKDLQLAYSQGNHTAYPIDIEAEDRYLSTHYPNIKSGDQRKNKQRKADDPKSEDKDNVTSGTAGAQVEDSTTSEDTTAPSREVVSLGAHVSETSQATSRPSRTVEDILEAHPIDDTFWKNTNHTDVSIVTVNSEE